MLFTHFEINKNIIINTYTIFNTICIKENRKNIFMV